MTEQWERNEEITRITKERNENNNNNNINDNDKEVKKNDK